MQTALNRNRLVRSIAIIFAVLLASSGAVFNPGAAFALSELRQIPGQTASDDTAGESPAEEESEDPLQLPMPDPLVRKDEPVTENSNTGSDNGTGTATAAEISFDISKAPEPVRRMRELIVEAAASGDIERLRPLLGKGMTQTQVSLVETTEGPVETLKGLSGDSEGMEILAILLDILSTGYARIDAGTPEEMYVWPYFTEKALDSLSPPEKVELLRLVTAGDFADMQEFGSYNFYRIGITPDGQWKFFIAGD
ncbi:MAG: hypothetical protein QHC90_16120 [Shinella sp.]|jgi:hypothetical protein|nr:hypothetical protein [Shinella sp.]